MLIVIPILTLLVVFLNLLGLQQVRPSRLSGCRVALLQMVLTICTVSSLAALVLAAFGAMPSHHSSILPK